MACKLLNCRYPIIGACMAGASGGRLAASVTLAGGFGFLSASYQPLSSFKNQLELARKELGIPAGQRLPIGAGYLLWALEKDAAEAKEALDVGIRQTQAIWLSFGDINKWFHQVKQHPEASKVKIFIVVSTLDQAMEAAKLRPDALVAQGIEAGGHGYSASPPLLTLVPLILQALPTTNRPLVVAAGGIVTRSQAAAALALGADAVALGTRLAASSESLYNDAQKKALVEASGNCTARSLVFDQMRGTLGWPDGVDGRALINKTYLEAQANRPLADLKKDFDIATKVQDTTRSLVWSGASVALIKDIKPAQEIVATMGEALQAQD